VDTVLRPLAAGSAADWHAWDWDRGADGPLRRTEPAEIVIVEGVGASCAEARPYLDAGLWVEAPEGLRRTSALARDGDTFAPFWQRWAEQELSVAGARRSRAERRSLVQGHQGTSTPHQVRRALAGLPLLGLGHVPGTRRTPGAEHLRRTHRPRALTPGLFAALYGGSRPAVWLDSSNAPEPAHNRTLDRNRFTVLADDGGRFGQSVGHRAGLTEVTAGASPRASTARSSAGSTASGAAEACAPPPATSAVRPRLARLPRLRAEA
jgi:anthranilate synthase component 1/para-aminobenzoate synthetase